MQVVSQNPKNPKSETRKPKIVRHGPIAGSSPGHPAPNSRVARPSLCKYPHSYFSGRLQPLNPAARNTNPERWSQKLESRKMESETQIPEDEARNTNPEGQNPRRARNLLARVIFRKEREFFVDNLLVRVHHVDQMTWMTGLAPWKF